MKKIGSQPHLLRDSAPCLEENDRLNQTQPRVTFSQGPVKLGEYVKTREQINKTAMLGRIKSNPDLIALEDPAKKELRQTRDKVIREIERLLNTLTCKKFQLASESLEQLGHEQRLIQSIFDLIATCPNNKNFKKKPKPRLSAFMRIDKLENIAQQEIDHPGMVNSERPASSFAASSTGFAYVTRPLEPKERNLVGRSFQSKDVKAALNSSVRLDKSNAHFGGEKTVR